MTRPSGRSTHQPGAVPFGLGRERGAGDEPCLLAVGLRVADAAPVEQVRAASARCPGRRSTVSPQTCAIASRVRSSGVGPRPPVVITRSASAERVAQGAGHDLEPVRAGPRCRSTSTPSAVSSRARSPELVSWVSPTSSSAPTASSSAVSIGRMSITSCPSVGIVVDAGRAAFPGWSAGARPGSSPGDGDPRPASGQQAGSEQGHRLEVERARIAHLAAAKARLELVDAAVGDAPHVVVAGAVRRGLRDRLPLQQVVGACLGAFVVHAAAGLRDGVAAAHDEQSRDGTACRGAGHQQMRPVRPERLHDASVRARVARRRTRPAPRSRPAGAWNSSDRLRAFARHRDARLACGLDVALGARSDICPEPSGSSRSTMRVRSCCRSSVRRQPAARSPVTGRMEAGRRLDRLCLRHRRHPAPARPSRVHRHVAQTFLAPDTLQCGRQRLDAPRVVGADRTARRVADAERGRAEPPDEQLDADRTRARVDDDPTGPPAVRGLDMRPAGQLEVATEGSTSDEVVPGGIVDPQPVEVGTRGIGRHARSMAAAGRLRRFG